jgi:hypothetical protein
VVSTRSLSRPATFLAVALLAAPAGARAQGGALYPRCAAQAVYIQDACQKGVDIFNLLAPQLGASLAGGNAVLGQSGPLGGLGRFSIGVRGNVLQGTIPQSSGVSLSTSGPQRTNFTMEDQILGLPTAEAAIGLFKGLPVGVTNVGGVDAIVSASFIPDLEIDEVSVSTTGGSVKLGYGARLGVLQETSIVPGVSITFLRRDLPRTSVIARAGSDTVAVSDIVAKSKAWRVVAGKRFFAVGLTAGAGQDTYDASAKAGAVLNRTIAGLGTARVAVADAAQAERSITRTNFFGDLTIYFPFARLTGEVGRVTGGDDVTPFNTFGGKTGGEAYTYYSAGLRVQF